jgi:hypothetical protein
MGDRKPFAFMSSFLNVEDYQEPGIIGDRKEFFGTKSHL